MDYEFLKKHLTSCISVYIFLVEEFLSLCCFITRFMFVFSQVCLGFNPSSSVIATGSMDTTCKLWDVEKGVELVTLQVRKDRNLKKKCWLNWKYYPSFFDKSVNMLWIVRVGLVALELKK